MASPASAITASSSSHVSNSTRGGVKSGPNSSQIVIMALIIVIAVCVLVLGVLLWLIMKKRRDNYHENNPPTGSFLSKSDRVSATQSMPRQFTSTVPPDGVNPTRSLSRQSTSTATPDGENATQYFSAQMTSSATPGDASGVLARPRLDNSGSSVFTPEELANATNRYAEDNLLGEGGFGRVYKGSLEGGKVVAVKKLKTHGRQGEREFRAEVDAISRVHHPHLVTLVGYCSANSERLLVYEFVPNGTLANHLHEKERPVMDWPTRLRIAFGVARGIAYLHEDCRPHIIHRDIKSANILLDNSFEAQVSDFGLAKFAESVYSQVTSRITGTYGYIAPECLQGRFSQRSDVYSFGVVLLELVTGRKAVYKSETNNHENLVQWAQPLLSRVTIGHFEAFVDPRLENNFDQGEMIRMIKVAEACVSDSSEGRPQMREVVRTLEGDAATANLQNGVNPGQSATYNSREISRLRMMAFDRQYTVSDSQESVGT